VQGLRNQQPAHDAAFLNVLLFVFWSQDSVVAIVTRLGSGQPRNRCSVPGKGKEILLSYIAHRPSLGVTKLQIQCIEWVFPRGLSGRGVNLTTYLYFVPRLRMMVIVNVIPPPRMLCGHKGNFAVCFTLPSFFAIL